MLSCSKEWQCYETMNRILTKEIKKKSVLFSKASIDGRESLHFPTV